MNNKTYHHIASRVLNKPLFLQKDYAYSMFNFLSNRMGFEGVEVDADFFGDDNGSSPEERYRLSNDTHPEWYLRPDNTAVIPIEGSLSHESSPNMFSSLGRSYQSIANDASKAFQNESTERVALLFDSNGGEVNGCEACMQTLANLSEHYDKPMWAFSDEAMYSAAYYLGVGAERIVLPKSAGVGSIGTVMTHASYEQAIEDEGVKITLIASGALKTMGHPYKDLSQEDFTRLSEQVQLYAGQFQGAVADRRGIDLEKVKETEAGIMIGNESLEGFADEVMNREEFFGAFAEVNRNNNTTISIGENRMDEQELKALRAQAAKAEKLEADLKKSEQRAEDEKAKAEKAEADAEAKKERFQSVLSSDAAKGRRNSAIEMLTNSLFDGFSAEQIEGELEKRQLDEGEEDPNAGNEEEEEEEEKVENLHPDTRRLLENAKKGKESNDVSNRGESRETKSDRQNVEDKEKTYGDSVESDRTLMMDSFINSAKIVGKNLSRSTI